MSTMWKREAWAMAALAVALVACGDDPAAPADAGIAPPPAHVVTRTDAATADECPAGGSVVSAGLDDNANQVLDDAEVSMRTVLCDDAPVQPPPVVVVRLVPEPAGLHCTDGGTAVQSGPDGNGNGQLDDDEVAHTDYVCDAPLVTRLVAEPDGANCVGGGVAVQTGRDRNHDHLLGDDEVEHTEYACGDILSRTVSVTTAADLAALAHIRVIQGGLLISQLLDDPDRPDGVFDLLSLPALEQIDGRLLVSEDKNLTRISLPALRQVGNGVSLVDNSQLVTIELPQLRTIGGSLDLSRNPELRDLPGFVGSAVASDVLVRDNAALETIQIPARIGGNLEVTGNDALAALSISVADRMERLVIARNGLQTLTILASDDHDAQGVLANVQILDNPQLNEILLFTDRLGDLVISRNAMLDRVALFLDDGDGDVTLTANPRVDSMSIDSRTDLFGPVEIAGSLTLSGPVTTFSAFGPLTIGRNLTIDGTQLTDLPLIKRVGGSLRVLHNAQFRGGTGWFSLGGGFELVDNAVLDHAFLFDADALNGNVIIKDNPALKSAQSLVTVRLIQGDVRITGNAAMVSADLFSVSQINGSLDIRDNAAVTEIGLTLLTHVDGTLAVEGNTVLPRIAMPVLAFGPDITIGSNPALTQLELGALVHARSLRVHHNHVLPACAVIAIFAHVQSPSLEQSDNDETATCMAGIAGARSTPGG